VSSATALRAAELALRAAMFAAKLVRARRAQRSLDERIEHVRSEADRRLAERAWKRHLRERGLQ
jgi:hypothetical protein